MNRICIIGAGGFADELFSEMSQAYNHIDKKTDIIFVAENSGRLLAIGENDITDEDLIILGFSNPERKEQISNNFKNYLRFISHDARVGLGTEIGHGTAIMAGTKITTNVKIGCHCLINLNCTIGHDSFIGDYTSIMPGANISGNVVINKGCYIGSNVFIKQGISICEGAVIGAGAVVLENINEKGTYVGVPAKLKR